MRRAKRLTIWPVMLLLSLSMTVNLTLQAEPAIQVKQQLQAAQRLTEAGQLEQAVTVLNDTLRQYPQELAVYNNLAVIYAQQGKLDAARDTLKKGLMVNAEVAALYANLDAVFVELSRQEYGKALRIDVNNRQLALTPIVFDATSTQVSKAKQTETMVRSIPEAPPSRATESSVSNEVNTVIQGWASAWSAQEVELYLSFYDYSFVPPNGLSRDAWEQQRRMRLKKPQWVEITLTDLNIESKQNGKVTARFLQHYKSNSYADETRKELGLSQTEQGWRIVSENSY